MASSRTDSTDSSPHLVAGEGLDEAAALRREDEPALPPPELVEDVVRLVVVQQRRRARRPVVELRTVWCGQVW